MNGLYAGLLPVEVGTSGASLTFGVTVEPGSLTCGRDSKARRQPEEGWKIAFSELLHLFCGSAMLV